MTRMQGDFVTWDPSKRNVTELGGEHIMERLDHEKPYLWVPYVVLTSILLLLLCLSFVRFHLTNRERYQKRIVMGQFEVNRSIIRAGSVVDDNIFLPPPDGVHDMSSLAWTTQNEHMRAHHAHTSSLFPQATKKTVHVISPNGPSQHSSISVEDLGVTNVYDYPMYVADNPRTPSPDQQNTSKSHKSKQKNASSRLKSWRSESYPSHNSVSPHNPAPEWTSSSAGSTPVSDLPPGPHPSHGPFGGGLRAGAPSRGRLQRQRTETLAFDLPPEEDSDLAYAIDDDFIMESIERNRKPAINCRQSLTFKKRDSRLSLTEGIGVNNGDLDIPVRWVPVKADRSNSLARNASRSNLLLPQPSGDSARHNGRSNSSILSFIGSRMKDGGGSSVKLNMWSTAANRRRDREGGNTSRKRGFFI